MSTLAFDKYQALGNDFVVLDGRNEALNLTATQIARLADRRLGLGCDQLLIARSHPQADLKMEVFNQDGSAAEQCGNGLRCMARYASERDWVSDNTNTVTIHAGGAVRKITRIGTQYSAEMGSPEWHDERIPYKKDAFSMSLEQVWGIESEQAQGIRTLGSLDFPNPHLVLAVSLVKNAPVADIGSYFQEHKAFPHQVNVGFMQVINSSIIKLRVYERGVGETPGCGSGAIAAVAAGQRQTLLDDTVTVQLPGGELTVTATPSGITQQGPADYVFSGQIPFPLTTRQAA